MILRGGISFDKGISDWKIYQRNERNCCDLFFSGTLLNTGVLSLTKEFEAMLVYEDTNVPVSSSFAKIMVPVSEDGRWEIMLRDVPAGGLYRFDLYSWDAYGIASVHNIGVGDIWVIAGQSNAGGFTRDIFSDPQKLGIHKFTHEKEWEIASHPLGNGFGHSPFLLFGKLIQEKLNIPIGLIPLAIGGSPLCDWNPAGSEAPYYTRMIDSVQSSGGSVRGMLWYQGCSDSVNMEKAGTYCQRFCEFIKRVRQDLNNPDMPVITAQLNRFTIIDEPASFAFMHIVREQQRKVCGILDNVGIIPTIDLSLCDCIHTTANGNMALGQRYANAALGMVYGHDIVWMAPEIIDAVKEQGENELILHFKHVYEGLFATHVPTLDFTVEDSDGIVPIDLATVEGKDTIRLKLLRDVSGKVFVHGGLGENPDISICRYPDVMPALCFYGVEVKI